MRGEAFRSNDCSWATFTAFTYDERIATFEADTVYNQRCGRIYQAQRW